MSNTNNKITQRQVAEYIHQRGGYVTVEIVARNFGVTNSKVRICINNMQRSSSYLMRKKPAKNKTCAYVYKVSEIGKGVAKKRLSIEASYDMPVALKNWLYGLKG